MGAVDMGGGIWASGGRRGGRSVAGVRGFVVVFLVIVTNVDVGVGIVGTGVGVAGEKMGLGIWMCDLWFVARWR